MAKDYPVAYQCAIAGCSNGGYKFKRWKQQICSVHNCVNGEGNCTCDVGFVLHPFPTAKRNPKAREVWKKLVNREDPNKRGQLWSPSKDSRVCSEHFVEGRPSHENPYPSLKLGYDSAAKFARVNPTPTRRKRPKHESTGEKSFACKSKCRKTSSHASNSVFTSDSLADPQAGHDMQQPRNESNADQPQRPAASNIKATGNNSLPNPIVGIIFYVVTLLSFRWLLLSKHSVIKDKLLKLKRENTLLRKRNEDLEKKIRKLRKLCKCSEPVHKTLLNNENVSFFTNFPSLDVFNAVHDFVAPFVKRRWKGVKRVSSKIKRKFASTPKKFGPARKLPSKDEFLLTLIKLRLGLLAKDLASRFKVSPGLSSQIFTAWLKALSSCLRNLIYVPDEEVIRATTPKRFDSLRNTHSIIDCSEIFIETPKNHILQSVTWSEYKHHNTLKFLVAVAPNSNIIYVSEAYAGKISDKKLTIDSGYLDNVPAYMRVLADKGFNIADECTARHIFLSVPPGKRGASQFMPSDVKKTSKIAKVRILVEQVIRRMKTFRLIANELPLSLVPQANDILIVCAALTNISSRPIFSD